MYSVQMKMDGAELNNDDEQSDITTAPSRNDPSGWSIYLKTQNFPLPDFNQDKIFKLKSSLTDTRKGSIGRYVYNNF